MKIEGSIAVLKTSSPQSSQTWLFNGINFFLVRLKALKMKINYRKAEQVP
jgi:hypothetical protein